MAAILKIVKSPHLSQKSSDFYDIWYTTSDIEPDDSHGNKNWKFLKFNMAAAAIMKIAFLAITHWPIVRFQRNFVWGSKMGCRQGYMTKTAFF